MEQEEAKNFDTNSGIYIGGDVHNSNVVHAQDITNSFNKAAASEADGSIKEALEALHKQVLELLNNIPDPEVQAKVAARSKTIAEEATKEKPDKELLGFSAKGLIEAANTVKELASPILATVTTILGFLGVVL